MRGRVRAAAAGLAFAAGLSACGASATVTTAPSVTAPSVLPVGAGPYTPATTGASSGTATCGNVEASLAPLPALPSPSQLPAGSFEAQIHARGYLIAGVDQNTYLFGYRDAATGQLSGFDIDMLRQVSQAIFATPDAIHYVVVPNADRVQAVESGRVDTVAETMTITCSRKQAIDFSSVYLEAGQRILVPGGSPITDATHLGGRRVCATAGSTSLQHLAALAVTPKPVLVQVVNQSDCLVLLQQHQVDAISTDDTILEGLAAQDPNVTLVGPAFSAEPYGMAISKAHPEFTAFVNAVLAAERADGTWAALYRKWLAPVSGGSVPAPPVATYQP